MTTRYSSPLLFCLGLLLLLLSCNPSTSSEPATSKSKESATAKICIQNVLALDDSLGTLRNHACEKISLSETVRQYADGMDRISYEDCPEAFTEAFRKHREAWIATLPVMDQYPDMRGEMHDLFKEIEAGEHAETFAPLLKAVWDTWGEVEAAVGK